MGNPKLPLTPTEKRRLRKSQIKIGELHTYSVEQLSTFLEIPAERARMLRALAEFQRVPSIGLSFAETIVQNMQIYSLKEVKNRNPAELLDELEKRLGYWVDPCVEDQIRCIIHYANNPGSKYQWFDFTEDRKQYRAKYGYPSDRPKYAWYELKNSTRKQLQKDLVTFLKSAEEALFCNGNHFHQASVIEFP